MANFQTVVNNNRVVRGSGMVQVAPYVDGNPAWVNVGAIKGLVAEEVVTVGKEENDNADSTDRFSRIEFKCTFDQLEILNLDAWEIMRSGLDTIVMESEDTTIISGSNSAIPNFMLKISTENGTRPMYITAYRCQIQKGWSFTYSPDDAEDSRLVNSIEIIGRTDAYRGGNVYDIRSSFDG